MAIHHQLRHDIVTFLKQFYFFDEINSRKAILLHAGLDSILGIVSLNGSPIEFILLLIDRLDQYGLIDDQTPALVQFLEGIASQVGTDKKQILQNFCLQITQSQIEFKRKQEQLSKRQNFTALENNTNQNVSHKEQALSLDNILYAHGYTRKVQNTRQDEYFNEAIEIFSKIISQQELSEYYNEDGGYNRKLFEHSYKPGRLALKKNHLNYETLKTFVPNEVFLSVLNALPEGFRLLKDGKFTDTECKDNQNLQQTITFLDGRWLEEYVYHIVKNSSIDEIERNAYITRIDAAENPFEMDLIAVKNSRLIGISCTIANTRFVCKAKGFENIVRSQQIGGETSKAILITFLSSHEVERLGEELQINMSKRKNMLVLGINDLEKNRLLKMIQPFLNN